MSTTTKPLFDNLDAVTILKWELFSRKSRELGRNPCIGFPHPLYSDDTEQIELPGRFGWALTLMLKGYVMRYGRDLIWHDSGEFFAKVVSAGVRYQIPYTFEARHLLSNQWQIEAEPGVPAQHTNADLR